MTKNEALKLAMDWYGSGNQDPDEFERLILSIVAQPEQEPLSDEEILTYRHMIDWTAEWSYINFARAIEAAHGIKGEA